MKNRIKYVIITTLILIFTATFSISSVAKEPAAESAVDASYENVFTRLYDEVSEYAGEILCAMTFAGSLILAVAYRKGLLPIVKGSLVSIGTAVNKIKESANENAQKNAEIGKSIEGVLSGAQNLLMELAHKVDALDTAVSERMTDEDERTQERAAFKVIISSQIDMLYDIFMTSALPQYQKDAVAEKIAKMKEALSENANAE